MKKILLSLAVLASLTASADALKFPVAWTSVVDGGGADHAQQVVPAADGGWFISHRFVTNGVVTLDGTPLDLSESTDYATNNSFLLVRYDANGSPIWHIHTDWGYENDNAMCATSDGGALVALRVSHTYNLQAQKLLSGDTLVAVKDTTGKQRVLFNQYPNATNRQCVLIKVDSEGRIDWMHPIVVKDKTVTEGFKLLGVGEYEVNGKVVYGVAGSYTTPLALAANDFLGSVDLDERGTSAEGIFCLTYDHNGLPVEVQASPKDNPYNLLTLVSSASLTKARIVGYSFSFSPLAITVALDVTGEAGSSIQVFAAGQQVGAAALSGKADDVVVIKVDLSTLSIWSKTLVATPNSQGKSDHRPLWLDIVDGEVYITGAISGGIALSTSASTNIVESAKAQLDGYIIGFDASGNVKGGATVGATISQLRKVVKGDNKIWAYGYQMTAGGSVEQGVFMFPVNPSNFEKGTPEHIVKSAGAPTIKDCALNVDTKKFVALMGENKAGTLSDGSTLPTPTGFHSVAVGCSVNMDLNAAQMPKADAEALVYGADGEIVVKSAGKFDYDVYNVAGQLIGKIAGENEASMKIEAGVYLVGDVKVVVK